MKSVSIPISISVTLSAVLATCALLCNLDFCSFILQIISVIVLLLPKMSNSGYRFSGKIVWASVMSQLLILVSWVCGIMDIEFLRKEFWMIPLSTGLVQAFQSLQAFFIGLMIVLIVYKNGFRITKRWMILAAMFVSLAYGVICMFGYFLGMYMSGLEVFNALGGYAADELNANMMSCAFVGVFVSAITAVLVARCSRNMSIDDFVQEVDPDVH